MTRILVLTGRDDITADVVVSELIKWGEEVVRYDTADFPKASCLAVTLTGGGWAGTLSGSRDVALESVESVWWRRPNEFAMPDEWASDIREFARSEARAVDSVAGAAGSVVLPGLGWPQVAGGDGQVSGHLPGQVTPLATRAAAGGRRPEQVRAAVAALEAAGRPVTGQTVGEALGVAERTGRRYLA